MRLLNGGNCGLISNDFTNLLKITQLKLKRTASKFIILLSAQILWAYDIKVS